MRMQKSLKLVLLLLPLIATAETNVYRSVDADGNVVFSDEPSEGAETIQIDEIQTVPTEHREFKYTPSEKKDTVSDYASLVILSPENDTAVRENAGNLSIKLQTEPALRAGDQIVLYMDGQEVDRGNKTAFDLVNLDRGTHSLSAEIVVAGSPVIRSEEITFTLLRHSSQHPPPTKPPPPP